MDINALNIISLIFAIRFTEQNEYKLKHIYLLIFEGNECMCNKCIL